MIGIVILNYIKYETTIRCVKSILNNPPSEKFKVIIVDNGSKNKSFQILSEKFSEYNNIIIDSLNNNLGFSGGNQRGINIAKSMGIEQCILVNSDIILNKKAINKMIHDLRTIKNIVIIGPKIMRLDGTHQPSLRKNIETLYDTLGLHICKKINFDENLFSGLHEGYSVSGCCFGINITRFEKMGAFDTRVFLYNEENILAKQCMDSKFRTYIDLDVSVLHEHAVSTGKDNNFVKVEWLKSSLFYWKVYRGKNDNFLKFIVVLISIKLFLKNNKDINPTFIFREGINYIELMKKENY